jgi:hypothetical protein
MEITEAQLNWLFGCLLIVGSLLAYPALTTTLALLRTQSESGADDRTPRSGWRCSGRPDAGRLPGQRRRALSSRDSQQAADMVVDSSTETLVSTTSFQHASTAAFKFRSYRRFGYSSATKAL